MTLWPLEGPGTVATVARARPPLAVMLLVALGLLTSTKLALLARGPMAVFPSTLPAAAEVAPRVPEVTPAAGPAVAAPLHVEELAASEILVLQELAERRARLEERERALELREALLENAKAEIEARLVELQEIRAEIEGRLGGQDEGEEAKLASLVKIYETMKPKAAALIFDRLDMAVLLQVVERMREPRASDVIARMDPTKARQLTTELARRRAPLHGES